MSSHNAHLGIVVGVDDSPAAKAALEWGRGRLNCVASR